MQVYPTAIGYLMLIPPDVTTEFSTFEMLVIVTSAYKRVELKFVVKFIVYFQTEL